MARRGTNSSEPESLPGTQVPKASSRRRGCCVPPGRWVSKSSMDAHPSDRAPWLGGSLQGVGNLVPTTYAPRVRMETHRAEWNCQVQVDRDAPRWLLRRGWCKPWSTEEYLITTVVEGKVPGRFPGGGDNQAEFCRMAQPSDKGAGVETASKRPLQPGTE